MGLIFSILPKILCFVSFDKLSFCDIEPHVFNSKLLALDGESYDQFGRSVALSGDGDTIVVGAPNDDDNIGSAYIFQKSTFDAGIKLVAEDGSSDEWFGGSVAVSDDGNTVVVGAYGDDNKKGSAYVFQKKLGAFDTGTKLVAGDREIFEKFGFSVAVSDNGETIVVGAYEDDNDKGSAYVFQKNGDDFGTGTKLVADAPAGDRFGYSVAVSGDGATFVVGAPNGDGGNAPGAAYVFQKKFGAFDAGTKLVASDGEAGDGFGYSVAVSDDGDTIVAGAPWDDGIAENSGAGYVFKKKFGAFDTGTKLAAPDGARNDLYGYQVDLSGDGGTIVVGVRYDDDKGSASGSAYVFQKRFGAFETATKLVAADGAATDLFGYSVAVSDEGDTIVVGAYGDNDVGDNSGSAYVFSQ